MQYSVRNRRRLRPTGEQPTVPRLARGTGVNETPTVAAIEEAVEEVRVESSGLLRTIESPVTEITPASVIKQNWQR